MSWLHRVFFRRRLYEDIALEVREHIEQKTARLMLIEGMSRAEAELAARRSFGNQTLIEERSREIWQWPALEFLWGDLRYALRQLRRAPAFALTAILTLALAIGANTAVFSLVNADLMRPLPFPDSTRLFQIQKVIGGDSSYSASLPLFLQWKQSKALERVAAYSVLAAGFNLAGQERPEHVTGLRVSADFFRVLGVEPAVGRDFLDSEDRPDAPHVVVLGYELWRQRYGGDHSIVGKAISIDGQPYTVIGILPGGFQFLAIIPGTSPIELWTPLQLPATSRDPAGVLECIARLRRGVTAQAAAMELTVLTRSLGRELPSVFSTNGNVLLLSLQRRINGDARPTLLLLFGTVALVLLIACVNVANLLLVRLSHRAKEIGLRTSLGASRSRIVRQILTESLALAFLGGAFGLALSWLAIRALVATAPRSLVLASEVRLDGFVLLFNLAVSMTTGIAFGLLPALRIRSVSAASSVRGGTLRTASAGKGHRRLSGALVIGETALALMLLISATLLIESFVKLRAMAPGFDYTHLATFEMTLPISKYGDPARLEQFLSQVQQNIHDMSGVESVAAVSSLPTQQILEFPFTKSEARQDEVAGDSDYLIISPGYFQTMRIPILEGRGLEVADSEDSPHVVVINRAMAQKFWPGQRPIGKRIVIAKNLGPEWADASREIVGVVADSKADVLEDPAPPIMYTPFAQLPPHLATVLLGTLPVRWILRTNLNSPELRLPLQSIVSSVDSQEPIAEVRPLADLLSSALARWRFNMLLLSGFGTVALLLAAIGIYGVISYAVTQRTQEIGIRMALGAERSSILWMIFREAGLLLGAGTLLGLIGVALLSNVLRGFLYGVTPTDRDTLYVSVAIMCSVGLIAAWRPAYRAASIDPSNTLRFE